MLSECTFKRKVWTFLSESSGLPRQQLAGFLLKRVAGVNAVEEEFIGGIGCARDAVVPFKFKNLGLHEIENVHPC